MDLKPILGWPTSRAGKWGINLALGFIGWMILFYVFVQLGQRGGATFFANPLLAVPLLTAAACGIAGGLVSSYAIAFNKERAAVLYVAVFVGFFVLTFTLGELFGTH